MTRLWYALRSLVFYVGYALIMVLQPLVGILLYYLLPSRWLRAWLVSACRVAVWWARVSCGIRCRVERDQRIVHAGRHIEQIAGAGTDRAEDLAARRGVAQREAVRMADPSLAEERDRRLVVTE